MEIIIPIIILVVLYYYFVIVKRGNISFWKDAAKHPDFVYEQLSKDDAWVIYDGTSHPNKKDFVGPFRLYVPSLQKSVKFYGKEGQYEESEERIQKQLRDK
ncbi:MAG: hypothetical protein WDZ40_00870 [Candidatus Spechtbacterales bacterium]